LEMVYDDELVKRFIGAEAGVNLLHAERTGFNSIDEELAWKARDTISQLPLLIRYRPQLTPRELRLECRRAQRELGKLDLAIVDYLGLMKGDHHDPQRFVEIGNIVVQLKAMAGEFGFPILLLAQINREAVKDGSEKFPPTLNQLRDSGTVEE